MNRAVLVTGCCLIGLVLACTAWGSRGVPWTDSVIVDEPSPRARDLTAYPEDGRTVVVNPPGFCWTPFERAKSYRLEVRKTRTARTVLSTEPQSSTVYPPFQILEPAEYEWQVVYLD